MISSPRPLASASRRASSCRRTPAHARTQRKKNKQYAGEDAGWFGADVLQAVIGQSLNKFTPLQLACYASALANKGTRYEATLLSRVVSWDYQDLIEESKPVVASTLEISEKALAALAGEDIPTYAEQMFEAGADLTGRDAEDVFCSDFKVFSRGDAKFGVGQSIYMTDKSRAAAEALVGPFLPEASRREGLPIIFYMFTDMKTQSTDLMYCGNAAEQIVREAFHVEPKDGKAWLPGVVSRKKQLIPPLLAALQAHQE